MKVIQIQPHPTQLLPQFVEEHPLGNIHQLAEWGEFQTSAANREKYWVLAVQDENENLLSSALIIKQNLPFNKSWLYSPRGPLVNFENPEQTSALFKEIQLLAKKENAVFFRFDPGLHKDATESNQNVKLALKTLHSQKAHAHYQPETTLMIDLEKSEEEILAQMKQKGRYNIKVAQKHGVEIEISNDPSKDIDPFFVLLNQTTERDGFHGHPQTYYQNMFKYLGEKRVKLYFAKLQNKPISACIVTYFRDTATYYFGASSNENRNVMAPYLLHFTAMMDAKKAGYKWYDFFGIAPENEPKHPWAHVTEFKKKFGGQVINYLPAQEIIYKKWWYRLIKITKSFKKIIRR